MPASVELYRVEHLFDNGSPSRYRYLVEDAVLTNREVAALVVLVLLVVFVLARPGRADLMSSVREVIASLMAPAILIPLLLYGLWISSAAFVAARIGAWDASLLKTTVLWLVLSGLGLVMRLNDAIERPGFFRSALLRGLGIAALIEFLATLKSFPLGVEIPTQALAVIFAGVAVVAGRQPESAAVRKLANGYLIVLGTSALVWSLTHLIGDWSGLDRGGILRELLLPIWLTPVALVFVYGFAVVAAYQALFRRMRIWNKAGGLLPQRLAVLARANVRLGKLRLLTGLPAQRIARTTTVRDSWSELGALDNERQQRLDDEVAAKQRLIDYAGVQGIDDFGGQLDRREFKETQAALRFLSTCHMGHYRNRDHRYRPDLLPIVESHFQREGLPESHGVEMHVSADGQRWYATRQALPGWWFAIGAAGPPPDEWLYDGPQPPQSFPAEPEWDRFGGGAASTSWD